MESRRAAMRAKRREIKASSRRGIKARPKHSASSSPVPTTWSQAQNRLRSLHGSMLRRQINSVANSPPEQMEFNKARIGNLAGYA
nr:hypothetical protein Itr_chr13CG21540 [Ipomoea trifida]